MSPYQSNKIKLTSFLCIIIVLYIHSYNLFIHFSAGTQIASSLFLANFEDIISNGIGMSAVPLFFAISGYLFFLNGNFSANIWIKKLISRSKTLVVPYFLWLGFAFILFFILQSVPQFISFFNGKHIADFGIHDYVEKIVYSPLCYQFWYIRDLIIFVAFTPFIYLLLQYTRWLFLLAICIAWYCGITLPIVSIEGFLLFSFGAYLAIHKFDFFAKKASTKSFSIVSILFVLLLSMWTGRNVIFTDYLLLFTIIRNTCLIVGVIFLWMAIDYLSFLWHSPIIAFLMQRTFFIFAIHEPLLTILKKSTFLLTGTNSMLLFITYIINPLIIIGIASLLSVILIKVSPKFYSLLVGGRG